MAGRIESRRLRLPIKRAPIRDERNRGSIRNNEWSYSEPDRLLNSKEAASVGRLFLLYELHSDAAVQSAFDHASPAGYSRQGETKIEFVGNRISRRNCDLGVLL